jgi:poly-gamma-glutamate synthesis protein (capsule biosynthesis protein)
MGAMIPPKARIAVVCVVSLALLGAGSAPGGKASRGSVRIAFLGDTQGYNIQSDPDLDGRDLLEGVRPVLGRADVVVFNHEETLIDDDASGSCDPLPMQSTFHASPEFAGRLELPGIAVAGLANNHAMDCGQEGLTATLEAFAGAGILTVGAGPDLDAACRPLEIVAGGERIVFLSYLSASPDAAPPGIEATSASGGVATLDRCDAEGRVRAAAGEGALVVVLLHAHWGAEWEYGAAPEHLAVVDDLLAWGASIVVSTGPHYPQGIVNAGSVAFLGLGDFLFRPDYALFEPARESELAIVRAKRGQVISSWVYPVRLDDNGLPQLREGTEARDFLTLVGSLSSDLGGHLDVGTGVARVPPR